LRKFIEVQILLIAPIAPHLADHVWTVILKFPDTICNETWPKPISSTTNFGIELASDVLSDSVSVWRKEVEKSKGKKEKSKEAEKKVVIYVRSQYEPWQQKTLQVLQVLYLEHGEAIPKDPKVIVDHPLADPSLKANTKNVMMFVAWIKGLLARTRSSEHTSILSTSPIISEKEIFQSPEVKAFLMQTLGVNDIQVADVLETSVDAKKVQAKVYQPVLVVI